MKIFPIVISFIVLSLVFFIIERVLKKKNNFQKPKEDLKLDIFYWIINPLFMKPLVQVAVNLGIFLLVSLLSLDIVLETKGAGFGPALLLPIPLQFFASLFVVDFISYWMHRFFHFNSWGWKVHSIHHSSENLDWLSSARVHPLNKIFNRVPAAFALLALGFPVKVFIFAVPFFAVYGILVHSVVNWSFGPFKYFLASPVFHRWHHTAEEKGLNKNFAGFFPLIDLMFGTFYMPKGELPREFGVATNPPPTSFWKQMIYPFRN